ncbi:MAG: hypothetical protein ACON4K_02055 [Akkermansiaceae bacterium]
MGPWKVQAWDHQRTGEIRYQDISLALIAPDKNGISSLKSTFSLSTLAGLKVRGSSTAKNPKP